MSAPELVSNEGMDHISSGRFYYFTQTMVILTFETRLSTYLQPSVIYTVPLDGGFFNCPQTENEMDYWNHVFRWRLSLCIQPAVLSSMAAKWKIGANLKPKHF